MLRGGTEVVGVAASMASTVRAAGVDRPTVRLRPHERRRGDLCETAPECDDERAHLPAVDGRPAERGERLRGADPRARPRLPRSGPALRGRGGGLDAGDAGASD